MSSTVEVKLADLCQLVSVQVDPQATPGLPYIGLEHVPPGRFCTLATGVASDALSAKFLFQAGDILYGKLRPYLDKAVLADGAGVCTTELLVLRPKAGIDSRYIAGVVHSPAFIDHAMSGVTGAHHPRTSWHHISQFTLPAHNKDERHGIADLLCQVDALLLICETACDTAVKIKQSAMSALFTRGLRGEAQKETEIGWVPESWDVVRLGDVSELNTGTTPSTKEPLYYSGSIPFIKTGAIVNNRIRRANAFISDLAISDYALTKYPPGTILMAMYGQGKTRGQVSLLEIEASTTQNAAAIQPKGDIDPVFLWQYLKSCYERLRSMGSLGHISHLNLGYLRELLVVKPPLNDQKEIALILDAIDRKIALHQQKRAVLDDLFKALLQKLMTGEIDVNDLDLQALSAREPATEGSLA